MNSSRKKTNTVKKAWKNNKELIVCGVLFSALFVMLSFYLCQYVAAHSEELFNNRYNSRQGVLAAANTRGTIYDIEGNVLAETLEGEDGKEYRSYPYDNLFAHAVGFASMGRSGLERLMNYDLANTSMPLGMQAENEADGLKNPGNDVYSTFDTKLQQAAYDSIGLFRGAVVVTEVKTGRILAMVSKPDFNPNEIEEKWEKISNDKEKAPLLNRASQGLYPPGSTFKIITALEYIRENPDTWRDYRYECTGSYLKGGNRIRCYHGSVHGSVDLRTSFARSCNASFANIGMSLDRESFGKTLETLFFNRELPVDFPAAMSLANLNGESSDAVILQTAIGQGETQTSPLFMNMLTAAIANQGTMMKPYMVDAVTGYDGTTLKQYAPETVAQLFSEEESAILTELMQSVVEEGTASKLKGLSYTAAGKTGSAEFNGVKEDSHAWFTGFAPAEQPEIAVTVIVEQVGSGGEFAVPIAKRIFDAYFAS